MFGFLGDNIDSVKQAAEVRGYPFTALLLVGYASWMADADSLLQVNNTEKDETDDKARYVDAGPCMHHPVVFGVVAFAQSPFLIGTICAHSAMPCGDSASRS